MATDNAPSTLDELRELLKDDKKVKVAGVDVDGVPRGKYMSKDKFLSACKSGFGFCSVVFGWDIQDKTYNRELLISNKSNGYHDILAKVDLSTYRRLPYESNLPFFLITFHEPSSPHDPIPPCPRSLLASTVDKIRAYTPSSSSSSAFSSAPSSSEEKSSGWECMAGVEYEYFQFKETAESLVEKKWVGLNPLTPGMHGYSVLRPLLNNDYYHALHDKAEEFGIPVEAHHTETGPGVFETALAYTSALRVADNAVLFKLLAKTAGIQHGVVPSFMAKPYGDLPGTSGHIHLSLRTPDGKNAFAYTGSESEGRPGAKYADTRFISEVAEHFLAGILDGLQDVMPMLCPTINSYKRLVGGEAFWAPNLCSYGYDSRAASIRIIGPPSVAPEATRFEVRVPGADMNPFYSLGAMFALGLHGIENSLPLPFPPISEAASPRSIPKLPTSLSSATDRFTDPKSKARVVFGDAFVDHFGGTREHECQEWERAVTGWERERYLELA